MAGRLAWLVAVALAAPGCLVVDPIDQRPAIDIRLDTPGVIHRGQTVELEAIGHDPEGQSIYYRWQAFACAEAPTGCDGGPFFTGTEPSTAFVVPGKRADGTPVKSVYVRLDGTDSGGATADPGQQLVISLEDEPPTVTVSPRTPTLVRGSSLPVFATVADPDDNAAAVQLGWQVFPPGGGATYTFTDYTGALPPGQVGKVLAPADDDASLGVWDVRATATDPLAMTGSADVVVNVVPDAPPCLSQWQPIAPTAPDALPITEPTLFEVEHVIDDLDPYPASATGETTFAWSLEGPGDTTHVPLVGATGNDVALDPSTYSPGDIVELRVEIYDRAHTQQTDPLPCDDAAPTCSLTGNSCLQRLTWRVEMR